MRTPAGIGDSGRHSCLSAELADDLMHLLYLLLQGKDISKSECVKQGDYADVDVSLLLFTLLLSGGSNKCICAPGRRSPSPVARIAYGLEAIAFDFALSTTITC